VKENDTNGIAEINLKVLSTKELGNLIDTAQAELSSRRGTVSLRVSTQWGGYNFRRYSRPWIARITEWPVGGKPEMEFGRYLGDDNGGECEIMARAGDILRSGQRDNRRPRDTIAEWLVVENDGKLRKISEAEARSLYRG
jgi:hypothetical protein